MSEDAGPSLRLGMLVIVPLLMGFAGFADMARERRCELRGGWYVVGSPPESKNDPLGWTMSIRRDRNQQGGRGQQAGTGDEVVLHDVRGVNVWRNFILASERNGGYYAIDMDSGGGSGLLSRWELDGWLCNHGAAEATSVALLDYEQFAASQGSPIVSIIAWTMAGIGAAGTGVLLARRHVSRSRGRARGG